MMLTRRNKDGIMGTLCDSPRAIFIDYACAVVQEILGSCKEGALIEGVPTCRIHANCCS